uniref:Uncharacterized protein n=1 Tax=Glossina austeni TaxID=7395 RepID=A0A1A9UDC0_GLOAU
MRKATLDTRLTGRVSDTYSILWDVLALFYMPLPNKSECERIADHFEAIWNLPHRVDAIDRQQINIVHPPNSSSQYYNYKRCLHSLNSSADRRRNISSTVQPNEALP